VAAQGAEVLFFLDYIAVGRLDPAHVEQLFEGVAEGCRQVGCAVVGGEIAEHPGALAPDGFDLVGFAVGVVERGKIVSGDRIRPGDALIGLPSPGLRSNGYSLARRVLLELAGRSLDDQAWPGAHHSLADELLRPSAIYAPALNALCDAVPVSGLAHVTGGGLPGNLARVLPRVCDAVIRPESWEVPEIFTEIQRLGEISDEEMAKVFNMGIGMVAVVPAGEVFRAHDLLRSHGVESVDIGEVVPGDGTVRL
jgi:phosphoribosylformylglycinamidine cyclo-ligase